MATQDTVTVADKDETPGTPPGTGLPVEDAGAAEGEFLTFTVSPSTASGRTVTVDRAHCRRHRSRRRRRLPFDERDTDLQGRGGDGQHRFVTTVDDSAAEGEEEPHGHPDEPRERRHRRRHGQGHHQRRRPAGDGAFGASHRVNGGGHGRGDGGLEPQPPNARSTSR